MMMTALCHLLLHVHAEWQGKAVNAYEALPVPVKGSLTLPEPPSNAAPDQLCAHWQRVHTAVEELSHALQQVRWCCMTLLFWRRGCWQHAMHGGVAQRATAESHSHIMQAAAGRTIYTGPCYSFFCPDFAAATAATQQLCRARVEL